MNEIKRRSIGIVNPGQMGVFIADALVRSGQRVHWCAQGRSEATRQRAETHGLLPVESLRELADQCEIIFSVCPPHAARETAEAVLAAGFRGLYVDANAISPEKSRGIDVIVRAAGAMYVDGGIIGNPAWDSGHTWLYLSGEQAQEAAACFGHEPLIVTDLGSEIGAASGIKMCFAAYTKGSTALICGILGTADALGVRDALLAQWAEEGSDFAEKAKMRACRVTAKAWRFEGEMREISETFSSAGLPGEFHRAAEIVYGRMAHFKDAPERPELDDVLAALRQPKPEASVDD